MHDTPEYSPERRVLGSAARWRRSPSTPPAGPLAVTVSVGAATARRGEPEEQALAEADRALYEAKGGGRNRVAVAAAETMPAR